MKDPVPFPSVVLELAIVGFDAVFQQTPRTDTAAPPSELTLPPLIAEVLVILVTAVVTLSTGTVADTPPPPPALLPGEDFLQLPKINNDVMDTRRKLIFIK